MSDPVEDFLAHHGVKGMKWGVRRSESGRVQLGAAPRRAHARRVELAKKAVSRKEDGSLNFGAAPKRARAQRREAKAKVYAKVGEKAAQRSAKKNATKHEIAKLSDAELRTRINRIQMEKQYAQLTKPSTNAGQKLAQEILVSTGKQIVIKQLAKYGTKAVEKSIKAAITASKHH